jgi:hypothetical protein
MEDKGRRKKRYILALPEAQKKPWAAINTAMGSEEFDLGFRAVVRKQLKSFVLKPGV